MTKALAIAAFIALAALWVRALTIAPAFWDGGI